MYIAFVSTLSAPTLETAGKSGIHTRCSTRCGTLSLATTLARFHLIVFVESAPHRLGGDCGLLLGLWGDSEDSASPAKAPPAMSEQDMLEQYRRAQHGGGFNTVIYTVSRASAPLRRVGQSSSRGKLMLRHTLEGE